MEAKIRVEEKQVKDLEEWAFDEAIRKTGGNKNVFKIYHAILAGIRVALLEVASNPGEVEEFIKVWRRD